MSTFIRTAICGAAILTGPALLMGQEPTESPSSDSGFSVESAQSTAEELAADAREQVEGFARQVDENPQAHEVTAGILQPIYALAEAISFPSFHWIAFTFMVTGVVSYSLQLVLGKLVLLSKMSFAVKEILSDAVGLIISVIGLVLTTQAAAQNSTFTESPAAVLSAAGVGALAGFIFYLWGQRQEVDAAIGRKAQSRTTRP